MTTNEHNTRPLGTTTTVTFTVDSDGNIGGGEQRAAQGDFFIVSLASGSTYSGSVYAKRDVDNIWKNKTDQLIGHSATTITVGTTYTIQPGAKGHSFVISTVAPPAAVADGPQDTTNGTLHVGSGNDDDRRQ
jgi:hypothetical protein